jgi:ribonuclease P protein component
MSTSTGAARGFPPPRLLSGKDFDRVYTLRKRVSDSYFSVNYAPAAGGGARLGLSVGAKMAGNSVSRNRVKRTVRSRSASTAPPCRPLDWW